MKNKWKLSILGVFLLLVSGCDGTYTVTFDKDLKINESMSMTEARSVIATYTNKVDQYGNTLINQLKKIYLDYSMSSQLTTDNLIGSGSKTFSTTDSFATDSILKKSAFKTVNITESNNSISIHLKDFDETNYLLVSDEIYGAVFENLILEIKSAYQVESSNAEEEDKTQNIYRWKFSKDKLPGEINIVINKEQTFNPPLLSNNTFLTIAIVGGVVVGFVIVGIVFIGKARENNRM